MPWWCEDFYLEQSGCNVPCSLTCLLYNLPGQTLPLGVHPCLAKCFCKIPAQQRELRHGQIQHISIASPIQDPAVQCA